jgi:hypothetical protein
MTILDFLKILLKTEGFSGAVVGLIAVVLVYLKVPQEITTAVLGIVTVILVALTTYLTAARIRARLF